MDDCSALRLREDHRRNETEFGDVACVGEEGCVILYGLL